MALVAYSRRLCSISTLSRLACIALNSAAVMTGVSFGLLLATGTVSEALTIDANLIVANTAGALDINRQGPGSNAGDGNTCADVHITPDGRFLYVSNRGHDSIALFAIDPHTGSLRFVETTGSGGRMPRSFGIVPGGRFLVAANQDSANVSVFRIDPERGTLSPAGHSVAIDRPAYVRFMRR